MTKCKLLRAEGLTRTYGEKTLFDKVDFIINGNDRIGLIGTNGSGKTSLLDTLAGLAQYSGDIITPNDYSIAYLNKKPEFNDEQTIMDAIFRVHKKVFKIIRRYEDILSGLQ